jgi:hypothetical protein
MNRRSILKTASAVVGAAAAGSKWSTPAFGQLREFSTPLLFNHSHRVFFWANELGRRTGENLMWRFCLAAPHSMVSAC